MAQYATGTAELRGDRVSWPGRLAFGVGDYSLNLVWQGTALFLLYVYTDVFGIAPATAGAIYLAAMVWDAVTDPLVAALVDRTRTRIGRYRPWLVGGSIPLAVSYPLAFSGPGDSGIDPAIWALATHVLLRTCYTIVGVPFASLQARLTGDARERTTIAGFRMAGAALGALTVVFVTPLLVGVYGEGREAEAYSVAASVAGVILAAGVLYCAWAIKEPSGEESAPTGSLGTDLAGLPSMLLRNGPLLRVLAIVVIGSICLAMFSKNLLYYFKYVAEREDLTVWALTMPAGLLLFTIPFWVWRAAKTSKARALCEGSIIAFAGYLMFWLVPAEQVAFLFSAIAIIGVGGGALPVLFWSMLPDTVEYGELQTGERAEARIFGFAAFAQKAAVGVNALLLGFVLDLVGFVANEPQTDITLTAIEAVMVFVPMLGTLFIIIISLGYPLDGERHAAIRKQLKEGEAATPTCADA
ncbi:MFS transporter [Erythrobacter ani]|uniref:MFS transporter n=1 Tax=Erythrobacter ani TaxID=2827235 RepID=A0ABS6SM67_9SPHN|nr:glycoside-pentoside-hexuronide (GPH):cation symporter [Erythrobacter ani]MBV7266126.1 MFS transporter [Erythrobacter ani]